MYTSKLRLELTTVIALLLLVGCQQSSHEIDEKVQSVANGSNTTASFNWFEYSGNDDVFSMPHKSGQYQNPIVSGFYPDPSITRKGDDYYMAVSSFAYAPGVPILHSKDLVNWSLVGHALTRESQISMQGRSVSEGIYAPTLRYHKGLFYMITTEVYGKGNFFVTATDPAGEWSEPNLLPEVGGIDPDIFFDDDGKVYITHNNGPEGEPLYNGHRAIWMWEYDLAAKKIVAESGRVIVNGGTDLAKQPIWIEAPHVYKINGWYYLLCAEGGTGYDHSEVVFRTRSLSEPFEPYVNNPILTQRDLDIDRVNPITTAGHADIVQTAEGDWWAVFLATRAYDKTFYNTGRESFLLPVSWENDWPHILPQGRAIPYLLAKPAIKNHDAIDQEPLTGNFSWRDDFVSSQLNLHWNVLRTVNRDWLTLNNGQLSLDASAVALRDNQQPAFIGRRQQHMKYEAKTSLTLSANQQFSAGLVAFQNEKYHYYMGVKKDSGDYQIFLEQVKGGVTSILQSQNFTANAGDEVQLIMSGDKADISFAYQIGDGAPQSLVKHADGKMLSTAIAQGFVGTMLGLHSRLENNQ
ncbi:glycoside hydrolase family 43 protein [Alteromonadaceae bacterium BrNp21-10]|nr:glycoside hydrolase family 43 protein [Alteromonadaceae bacterium BrNp21-10]